MTMEKKVYSVHGDEIRSIQLSDEVFGLEANDAAIYYAINNELANARVGTASTKTRAEVHGSNAKPWKQKGTGRARAGQKRSPLWVHGGVIFGPRPRDYHYKVPRKLKQLAMKTILSLKAREDRLKIVEDFTVASGKTKDLVGILSKLVDQERAVFILKDNDAMIKRAGANIPWLSFLSFDRLRAHDLFYGRRIVVLESAVQRLNEFYGNKQ
jgi:large subunit ribosomal protein L4